MTELGFVGCLLNPDPNEGDGTAPPGLGDRYWYPLYEKLCELDVPAMIHSASCSAPRESYSLHFINEESIAVLGLLTSKVLDDFPELKIVVAHGGGAIPYQLGRFRARNLKLGAEDFAVRLRRLHFDTVLYSVDALELLHELVVVRALAVQLAVLGPPVGGEAHLRTVRGSQSEDDRRHSHQLPVKARW